MKVEVRSFAKRYVQAKTTIQVTAIDEEDWFYMIKRFEEV